MIDAPRRPVKEFEVIRAYGPYVVGMKVQPTGVYRDILLRRGIIKEIVPVAAVVASREVPADTLFNRDGGSEAPAQRHGRRR